MPATRISYRFLYKERIPVIHYEDLGPIPGVLCQGRCGRVIQGKVMGVLFLGGSKRKGQVLYTCEPCAKQLCERKMGRKLLM